MAADDFSGKTVIVTGASQGIGAAIARAFAAAGAKTVVHYRSNQQAADSLAGRIRRDGGLALAVGADLAAESGVVDLLDQTRDKLGSPDVLINNAGGYPVSPLLDLSLDEWRQMYADNVDTTFICTRLAAAEMKKAAGGVIINIGSISGIHPGPDHSHYNSAKAAVEMFTRSAALELGPHNIRVNAVAPGVVYRPGMEDDWPDGLRRYRECAPLGCEVQAEDVANACLFLASDKAARITGVVLPVDSGVTSAPVY